MAGQRLSALPARELVVPSSSATSTTEPVAGDGLVAELLRFPRPDLSTHDSDFQRLVSNIVELAEILTGASGSAIAFRGERGTICRARSGEGAPPLGALVDTTFGISRQCLDSGTSLRCDDIATDGRVDSEISQAIGIRAVAVVPIFSNGNNNDDICGILEVFSDVPGVFTDHHLKTLRQLADWVGSANMPSEAPICGSNSPADLAGLSIQSHGWNDVLVESHIPWKRFIESVLLHIVVIGMLSGLSIIWPRELIVSPPSLREAHIVYYPFSQSFPARESSRPAVRPMQQQTSAPDEVVRTGRDREPLVASGTRATDDRQEIQALTTPPPVMPMFASSRSRKPELGAAVLPPPPDIDEAKARQSHPPDLSVVAPSPDLSGGSRSRRITAPRAAVVPPSPEVRGSISMKSAGLVDARQLASGSARAADISIVPPPPSLSDHAAFTRGATGVISNTGVQVVAPPSSVPDRSNLDSRASNISPEGGASQVVPPPPSLEVAGAGNSVEGGRGRANSLADGGSQVVPPAPSIHNGGNSGEGGRINSLGQTDSQVVPPAPSVQFGTGGNSGAAGRGRATSLAGARAEAELPPASAHGDGTSKPGDKLGGTTVEKNVTTSSVPETGGDRKHPIFQDVQLRVISLTWAPSRSSYFSSFEVFIAEKWLNKKGSEFIKLVYEFLPYQQRLSEYGSQDLKVRRLRVTRDSTCDESLMQMAWPEGENGPPGSQHSGDALASTSTDRDNALPCYRTTADDYRRAVSRSR
jgi:GAF domain-containing protein